MCGHDIHITCLVGGAAKILEKINQIPSDKHVRLLFQPAEEQLGGAFGMIQEGALLGVDEVYGMHNTPHALPGELYIQKGYMTSCITPIDITVYIIFKGYDINMFRFSVKEDIAALLRS
jgi:metal-dependent amidase/aminoacylase/carboxypeptidase family protein